jgi:methionyl-tRNA synthetase
VSVSVLVIPQPTVNGPLHVGHLSGPYLAADVAIRAARLRGDDVLAVAGVDKHQNYVAARADELGVGAGELAESCRQRILAAFGSARIDWDTFLDPVRDTAFAPAVAALMSDLVRSGAIEMRETELHRCDGCGRTLHHVTVTGLCACGVPASGGSCEACGGFTSARTLTAASCTRCGGSPEAFRATVPVLVMEQVRDRLMPMWLAADLPPRVRALVRRYLDEGLPEVPLAYPTDWGIEGEGPLEGLRVDVYAELALGYLHGVAEAVAGTRIRTLAGVQAAWTSGVRDFWQFHGIDNAFYFAILVPAMFAAAGLPTQPLAGLVVNEFLLLDGLKFSTSRDHAIWVDEMLPARQTGEHTDLLRLFLCWHRPDRRETDFSLAAWAAFSDWVAPVLRAVDADAEHADSELDEHSDAELDRASSRALPAALADAELDRAEAALHPAGFDPALAVRCVLGVLAANPRSARGRRLLAVLLGRPVAVPAALPAPRTAQVA